MNKKTTLGLFILLISIIAGVAVLAATTGYVRYTDCVTSWENILEIREKTQILESDARPILYFDEQELFYDEGAGVYFYSLREGNRNALNPRIRVGTSAQGGSQRFLWKKAQVALIDPISEVSIAGNESFSILIFTEDIYFEAQLKCTTLPLMNIACQDEIIYEGDVPMEMTLFDNSAGTASPITTSKGYIHVRGQYSRFLPQKSYRFSLTTDSIAGNERGNIVSLLGLRQDDDWILYSGAIEETKAENVFATNLWNESCGTDNQLGVNTGTRYKYVEVFLNNEYLGLYALGYPVDEKGLSQSKTLTNAAGGTIASTDGALFKKKLMTKESSLTGYIMSGENDFLEIAVEDILATPQEDSLSDLQEDSSALFSADVGESSQIEYSTEAITENARYLYDFYEYLEANRNDSKALEKYVDLDNLIDYALFTNLVQAWDAEGQNQAYKGRSSSFLYNMYLSIREYKGGLLGLYCPWDLDSTWEYDPSENFVIQTGYLNQLIANGDTDIVERMCEKYFSLRADAWSEEKLLSMLAEQEAQIFDSGAYLRSMERWEGETFLENPEEKLSGLKESVLERLQEADAYYERLQQLADTDAGFYELMAAQYKNLDQKKIILHFGEGELFGDADLVSFLISLGVDPEKITPKTTYVAIDGAKGIVEYYQDSISVSLHNGTGEMLVAGSGTVSGDLYYEDGSFLDTVAGRISLSMEFPSDGYTNYREDCYGVFVDDIFAFATRDFLEAPISLMLVEEDEVIPFNFEKDFAIETYEEIFY